MAKAAFSLDKADYDEVDGYFETHVINDDKTIPGFVCFQNVFTNDFLPSIRIRFQKCFSGTNIGCHTYIHK